jgi:hypothetical protein
MPNLTANDPLVLRDGMELGFQPITVETNAPDEEGMAPLSDQERETLADLIRRVIEANESRARRKQ